jgi:shikimate kinase
MNGKRGKGVSENAEVDQRKPRVVEVVGPAGAGKTTLCRALTRSSEDIQASSFPNVRKLADTPFFFWNGLQLVPTLLRLRRRGSRKLTRREFAWLAILNGWPAVLQKQLRTNDKVILLDQGPVFLFTEIGEFGPEYLRTQHGENIFRALYGRWATLLDAIVWLDSSDADLQERIRTRDKEHPMKKQSADTVFAFLERYRSAYERTASLLMASRTDIRILRLDTNRRSPDEIADQLLIDLGLQAPMA